LSRARPEIFVELANASEEKLQKIAIGTAITGKTSERALTPCLTLFCRQKQAQTFKV